MTVNDVIIVEVPSAIDAAAMFKSGNAVDAAVVWSPDDDECVKAVKGAWRLTSTKEAPFIIADGFYAKRDFVNERFDDLVKMVEAWMVGASEINTNVAAKNEAIRILVEGLGVTEEIAMNAINNVRLCTFEDNLNFFGLNTSYQGITGEQLYLKTGELYRQVGMVSGTLPAWRQVSNTRLLQRINLSGSQHAAWDRGSFGKSQTDLAKAQTFSTKPVSVVFASGSWKLDFNAMSVIDREADEMKLFANLGISIEGNTDNTGSYEANQSVSLKRAQAVADYLVREHGIDRHRIIVKGNGWNNPIATNDTPDGRAQNRRTDFKLLK
ncbi:MAG: hypothetical protein E4H40_03110 [Candidatus Brocadiia bacterium]|nr:MAG: hypothetical protein E4H40_03110 [Candidatus Brocadiia bacterium]